MNFFETLGTIFYNYGELEETCTIISPLFGEKIGEGDEFLVYKSTKGNHVYKVSKLGFFSMNDLSKYILSKLDKNKCPLFLKMGCSGFLKHKLADIWHPVFNQRFIQPLESLNISDYINEFKKYGYIPTVSEFTKDDTVIYDITPKNCGIDEEGNFKIIDCKIYKK